MLAILKKHNYEVNQEIHKGQNSKLFSVVGPDHDDYVVKIVKDATTTKSRFMFHEQAILEKLKGHDVIINLEQVFEDVNLHFYFFKLCKYGSFESFATSGFARHVQEPTIKQLCKQLCEAIKIVHENGIIHGEIHSDNILVYNKYKNDDGILLIDIKLAGFSRSIFVDRVSEIPSVRKLINQPMTYSPERMQQKYCQSGDMWATGILIFQLGWGYMPFHGNNINELAHNIIHNEFDPRKKSDEEGPWFSTKKHPIDDFGKQLVGNMLQYEVKDRYTAKECLDHSWLNSKKQPWTQLLELLNSVKTTTKYLKFRFHLGGILSMYLPKRTIDMVKDFQHIYLNKRTHNGKIQNAEELSQIIEKLEEK